MEKYSNMFITKNDSKFYVYYMYITFIHTSRASDKILTLKTTCILFYKMSHQRLVMYVPAGEQFLQTIHLFHQLNADPLTRTFTEHNR